MSEKESPKLQELGPKKYKKLLEDSNKHYDKYKAGKRDPETGEYYYHISSTDPRKSKIGSGKSTGAFECFKDTCGNVLSINRTTVMIQCCNCKTLHRITQNKLTDEFEIELIKLGE